MRILLRPLTVAVLLAALALTARADDKARPKTPKKPSAKTQAEREQAFMEHLSGTTLTGFFSIVGQKDGAPPAPDSYQITKVTKQGNFFMFQARFGETKLPPLPLRVVWARTKPVITMDTITIPLLGTFSVHLLIDGNRYAGTWSHGKTLGHMWGTIARTKVKEKEKKATKSGR